MTLTTKWPVFVPDPSRDLPCPADVPGPMSAVLDTDTYNEIDDQFALVYALLSPQRLTLEACYAAPFHNNRSTGPADGMAKSYEENGTRSVDADERFGQRQRWVLAQLASGVKLTRRAIQEQFNVSDRTAKRDLTELVEAGLIAFDRSEHPGFYQLR